MHPCEIFTHPSIPPITPTSTVEEQVEQVLGEEDTARGAIFRVASSTALSFGIFSSGLVEIALRVHGGKVCKHSNEW